MATVLITGGTGLIGRALTKELLDKGDHVIILTRSPEKYPAITPGLNYSKWDIEQQFIDKNAITSADHIIHLAGAGVADKRWTAKRKKEILESRTKSSELLLKAINETPNKIKTIVSASAIGWYGPDPVIPNNQPFTEDDPAHEDFLGQTCRQWEESIEPVILSGKRLVKLRTGIVLSKEGGALKEFRKPLRFGLATILGSGRQIISWIHIGDLVSMYLYALKNESLDGVYNAVAPFPITNKKFVIRLARIEKGRFFIPIYAPSFVLDIVLGEMSIEVLKSATVSCEKIKKTGFVFQYPEVGVAFKSLQQ